MMPTYLWRHIAAIFLKASPHNCVCGLRPIFCPIRAVIKGGNTSACRKSIFAPLCGAALEPQSGFHQFHPAAGAAEEIGAITIRKKGKFENTHSVAKRLFRHADIQYSRPFITFVCGKIFGRMLLPNCAVLPLRRHSISPYHTKIKDAARMICLAASFFAKCVNPVL